MAEQVRVFVDFWNLQLNWNERSGGSKCDWTKLPMALVAQAATTAQLQSCQYQGTRVYASVDPANPSEENLRRWLDGFLDRLPGINVCRRERHCRRKPARCRTCKHEQVTCPKCNAHYDRAAEKGVDAAIITDLFSLAWERAYDVAVLATCDGDFVPAVQRLQDKGFKIVNATWRGHGHELAKACWASFELDPLIAALSRPPIV